MSHLHAVPDERDALPFPYHAEEFDQAIMDLARAISATAMELGCSTEYAPVLGHLVKARRIIKEKFPR